MSLPEPGYNGSSGLCSSPPCSKENHKTSSRLLLSPKKSESSSSSLITSSGQKTCTGDVDSWIEQLMRCEKLEENEVFQLCLMAKNIIEQEPNLVNIQSPVTVCGDVHGQFQDLLKLFSTGGFVPHTNYLFLGDYVDRGRCSVETISLLVALKVRHRNRITLLRGNHESRSVSNVYGFYDECVEKYKSFKVWIYFTDLFDLFPLAALVDNIFFCLHGGLSKKLPTLDEIRQLDRLKEVPKKGPMTDLLWADPMPDHENGWRKNIVRGCSCMFGENVSSEFNQLNNLELIARAHQVVVDGYKWHHDYNVLTLFSAPNYCYSLANKAAIMEFYSNQTYWIRQFNKSPISDTVSTTQYTSFYDR